MDREKVHDERVLHAGKSVHLCLYDKDGSLLENGCFAQYFNLPRGGSRWRPIQREALSICFDLPFSEWIIVGLSYTYRTPVQ